MGMIWKKKVNLKPLKDMACGLIAKGKYFNQVPTLKQKNLPKGADCAFTFKFKYEDEWYLASFYDYENGNKVSLDVVKWVE